MLENFACVLWLVNDEAKVMNRKATTNNRRANPVMESDAKWVTGVPTSFPRITSFQVEPFNSIVTALLLVLPPPLREFLQ